MPDTTTYQRRAFFEKLVNRKNKDNEGDRLFERFSKKASGVRYYTPTEEFNKSIDHPVAERSSTDGATAERGVNISTGLAAYSGAWTIVEVMHLLKRSGYGACKSDVDYLLTLSPQKAVQYLFTFDAVPALPSATPLNNYQSVYADSAVVPGADWTTSNMIYSGASSPNDGFVNTYRQLSLIQWSWGLLLQEGTRIREKMVNFWYHFIPVNFSDIRTLVPNSSTMSHDYIKLLRDNALGNFKSLIQQIAKAPAMLVYLSNHYSTASAPNENFARELLELFLLGKEPTQYYTEADVQAGAKVLSGWKVTSFVQPHPFVVSFTPAQHNQSDKSFSANFGNTTIRNVPGDDGATEFTAFFNMLFARQGTTIARYLCRRIYRYFVYYDIDAQIENNVIVPMADALIAANWEMRPIMQQLLSSQHFYDAANRGVMIKSPQDLIAGVLRTLNVTTAAAVGADQLVNQYKVWENLDAHAKNNMDQGFGLVPNVSGWKAYYQAPAYYQNWISANTIQKRSGFLSSLVNGYNAGGTTLKIDGIAFLQQFPNATIQDPDAVVDLLVTYLLPVDLPQSFKEELKTQNLLSGQVNNTYWTSAWNSFTAAPTNSANRTTVANKLKSLIASMIQLAEFQLM